MKKALAVALATIPSGKSLNSTAFHTYKKLKKSKQSKRYGNYLSKVNMNFNIIV